MKRIAMLLCVAALAASSQLLVAGGGSDQVALRRKIEECDEPNRAHGTGYPEPLPLTAA